MKCKNHKNKNSIATCTGCGNPFCEECMIKVGRRNLCKECASENLKENETKNNSAQPNIVITQQTTNQQSTSTDADKPRGSGFWLCFWIIVFWPVAIFYYFTRRWK